MKSDETPILLIIFNRPSVTRKSFGIIRKLKPSNLYIAADGPRKNRPGEKKRCEEARKITENIDWPCEVKRLYQKNNLGCGLAPAKAIGWFFSHVDKGIILEDDCVPSRSFFSFCSVLLDKYENSNKIMSISGDNFQNIVLPRNESYYFSLFPHSWGWATWRRAWKKYDFKIESWKKLKKENWLTSVLGKNFLLRKYWEIIFDSVYKGNDSIWDYQWTFTCWKNNGLAIIPKKNLVSNVGTGEEATHTKRKSEFNDIVASEIDFPLIHPKDINRNEYFDSKEVWKIYLRPRIAIGLIVKQLFKR